MNSIWLALFWKELRELKGKIFALSAIAFITPVMLSMKEHDNVFGAVTWMLVVLAPLSGLFLGMHAAASEQSRGTMVFMQGLPIGMRRPAAAKLAAAMLAVIAPVAVAVLTALFWKWAVIGERTSEVERLIAGNPLNYNWGATNWYLSTLVAGCAAGVSILLWMAAAGINRSDEVHAGAVGILVIGLCWALIAAAAYGTRFNNPPLYQAAVMVAPGGASATSAQWNLEYEQMRGGSSAWNWITVFGPHLLCAILSHAAVAAWYIFRFGRAEGGRRQAVEKASATIAEGQSLGPPRSSPFASLVWKQMRESAPLGLMGAALVMVAVVWAGVVHRYAPRAAEDAREMAMAIWGTIGFFVAIVAGVGAFMDDLRPGLHAFWRSRPIGVDQWFAIKFMGGLIATIPLLLVPLLVLISLWTNPVGDATQEGTWRVVANSVTLQVVVYCAAAAVMTLVRQPICAAVLTIGVVIFSIAMFAMIYPEWELDQVQATTIIAAGVFAIVATEVARQAVNRDWGWKP